jgi:hypothetical protein
MAYSLYYKAGAGPLQGAAPMHSRLSPRSRDSRPARNALWIQTSVVVRARSHPSRTYADSEPMLLLDVLAGVGRRADRGQGVGELVVVEARVSQRGHIGRGVGSGGSGGIGGSPDLPASVPTRPTGPQSRCCRGGARSWRSGCPAPG